MIGTLMNSDEHLTIEQIEEQSRAIEEEKRRAHLRLGLIILKAEKITGFPHPSHYNPSVSELLRHDNGVHAAPVLGKGLKIYKQPTSVCQSAGENRIVS